MKMGLNFASQLTMTAVKPREAESVVVMVWSVPATSSSPVMPQSAGDYHRAHYHALDLDADIARGALALAYNAYLIAVLGIFEVDVHGRGYDGDDKDVEHVLVAAYGREPAYLRVRVDYSDVAGALGRLPDDDEEGH